MHDEVGQRLLVVPGGDLRQLAVVRQASGSADSRLVCLLYNTGQLCRQAFERVQEPVDCPAGEQHQHSEDRGYPTQ